MARDKSRPERRQALLRTMVRDNTGWSELTVNNVSEHGMMLRGAPVPEKGTIIEIRIGEASIVGEVRWSFEGKCGVRSRDAIDVEALLSSGLLRSPSQAVFTAAAKAQVRTIDPRDLAERSRLVGRLIDYGLIVALVVVGAAVVAGVVSELLGRPFRQVQSHLSQPD